MDEQVNETADVPENKQETEIEVEVVTPIVVDLGKTKAKKIKRLKRGEGPLMEEIVDVMDEVVEVLGDEVDGKIFVPIVIIYEKKPKQKRSRITLPF